MTMKLYVCGPMTGLPALNYPAFQEAKKRLMDVGFSVRDPSEIDELHANESVDECIVCRTGTHQWEWYMKRAIIMLMRCDGVACLPDWTDSKGAKLEVSLARSLRMPVYGVGDWIKHPADARRQFARNGKVIFSDAV